MGKQGTGYELKRPDNTTTTYNSLYDTVQAVVRYMNNNDPKVQEERADDYRGTARVKEFLKKFPSAKETVKEGKLIISDGDNSISIDLSSYPEYEVRVAGSVVDGGVLGTVNKMTKHLNSDLKQFTQYALNGQQMPGI